MFCIILGVTFSVLLILIALFGYNNCKIKHYLDHYIQSNFPTDSDGKLCGVDLKGYPYVYFAQPPQIVYFKTIFRLGEFVLLNVPRIKIEDLTVHQLMR